ncbi:hypothetical protein HanIR_Chr16g0793711 [Helianthus annuus]|nr:hypothetical protein HanIR_Chr16g0793711 [Helianthus annuus]
MYANPHLTCTEPLLHLVVARTLLAKPPPFWWRPHVTPLVAPLQVGANSAFVEAKVDRKPHMCRAAMTGRQTEPPTRFLPFFSTRFVVKLIMGMNLCIPCYSLM